MDKFKVSVCIVTYNQERYIAQTVRSVLEQNTRFPVEIVIGDDCSTDNTRSILCELAQQHPTKIHLRLAERNQGANSNFLATVATCRGQYIAMLEGDDYWTCPGKLQMQADALDARPDWAICFHPAQCIYEDGMQGQPIYPLAWERPEATLEDLFQANFMPTGAVMYRNRLFSEFPTWFRELQAIGDWPLHILNAANGNIGFLPDVMSVYRVHRHGLWSGATPEVRLIAIFKMFNAVDHHFDGKYAEAIDRYRLNAISVLIREMDALRGDLQKSTTSEQELRTRNSRLVEEMQVQKAAHQSLVEFHNTWSKSLAVRLVRESRRPFGQLWNLVRRRIHASHESQLEADHARQCGMDVS